MTSTMILPFLNFELHYTFEQYRATNQKVAGSIPDGVIWFFRWHNPSDRTMALEVNAAGA
jgi:hypothetical protein